MEATELRISNYVNYKGKPIVVLSTDILACEIRKPFSPIPLTEQWLLDFGFDEKGTIENENYKFSIMYYDCWNISYEEKKGYGESECFLRNFWSVHQLQNLYFALTQTELILTP